MISFKEYLIESTSVPGNYISIKVDTPIIIAGLKEEFPDCSVCIEDQHVTLMYSVSTDIAEDKIYEVLDKHEKPLVALLDSLAAFDSPQKEGQENMCAIVVKLKPSELNCIHSELLELGLKHSYPEFSPHISLIYKVPMVQKEKVMKFIESKIGEIKSITLSGFTLNPIDTDWSDKVK